MAEPAVGMSKDKVPPVFGVTVAAGTVLDVVCYNGDGVGRVAEHVLEEGADDGFHAGGEDDDRDVLRERPFVEGFEARVEFDVLDEEADAFVVGCLGVECYLGVLQRMVDEIPSYFDGSHHFVEAIAEVLLVVEDVLVALLAHLLAEA